MEDGTSGYDAVVLAGGAASRLGGTDKPALRLGGSTLLDRVLAICADARTTIVVGPRKGTARPVTWTWERPPGGGPLPALAAGLRLVRQDTMLLLAADLPFLAADTVRTLLTKLAGDAAADGVMLTDPGGRDQPLVGAYRVGALRRRAAVLAAEHGGLTGLPLRSLTGGLALQRVTGGADSSFDCDTWDDVRAARARLAGGDPGVSTDSVDRGA